MLLYNGEEVVACGIRYDLHVYIKTAAAVRKLLHVDVKGGAVGDAVAYDVEGVLEQMEDLYPNVVQILGVVHIGQTVFLGDLKKQCVNVFDGQLLIGKSIRTVLKFTVAALHRIQ